MAIERSCDTCGTRYVAKRKTSRYCSASCRTRASRAGFTGPGSVVDLPVEPTYGPVETVTRRELEDVGRLDTVLGQACVVLARRLDSPKTDTGSAMAGVVRELRSVMADATKGTAALTKPQQLADELAARRERQGA